MGWCQQHLVDPVLMAARAAYVLQIAIVMGRKDAHKTSYTELANKEEIFINKTTSTSNPRYGAALGATLLKLSDVEAIVTDIETNLNLLPFKENLPFYANIFSELETEKGYLSEIRDDLDPFDLAFLLPEQSGGVGFSLNYLMKIYLRCKKTESKLLDLQYRTNNLGVFRIIFLN